MDWIIAFKGELHCFSTTFFSAVTWLLSDDLLCAVFSWPGKPCLGGVLVSTVILVGVADNVELEQKETC